jgi:hypothetical protein
MTIHAPARRTTPGPDEDCLIRFADAGRFGAESAEGDWGPWRLDTDTTALFMQAGSGFYDVGLDQCRTEAGFLHWLAHLHGKTWVDTRTLGGFLAAVDDVIGVRRLSAGAVSAVELADAVLRASDRYSQVRDDAEATR